MLEESVRTPTLAPAQAGGLRLQRAGPDRWRVVGPSGLAVGQISARPESDSIRYHARRFHVPSRSFREVGAFWSADDAVSCLRWSR